MLEGQRFNRLTIVGEAGRYRNGTKTYKCICDCGGTATTSLAHLKRGEVQSCGCISRNRARENGKLTLVAMLGRRFGKLVVVREGHRSKNGTVAWVCHCDCGVEKTVSGHLLRRGSTQSCGCLSIALLVANNVSRTRDPWTTECRTYESMNAKSRGLEFSLTPEEFRLLVTADCHYCGGHGTKVSRRKELRDIVQNGIDRKDNTVGYTSQNCVPCCKVCNRVKSTLGYQEFLSHVRKICIHIGTRL